MPDTSDESSRTHEINVEMTTTSERRTDPGLIDRTAVTETAIDQLARTVDIHSLMMARDVIALLAAANGIGPTGVDRLGLADLTDLLRGVHDRDEGGFTRRPPNRASSASSGLGILGSYLAERLPQRGSRFHFQPSTDLRRDGLASQGGATGKAAKKPPTGPEVVSGEVIHEDDGSTLVRRVVRTDDGRQRSDATRYDSDKNVTYHSEAHSDEQGRLVYGRSHVYRPDGTIEWERWDRDPDTGAITRTTTITDRQGRTIRGPFDPDGQPGPDQPTEREREFTERLLAAMPHLVRVAPSVSPVLVNPGTPENADDMASGPERRINVRDDLAVNPDPSGPAVPPRPEVVLAEAERIRRQIEGGGPGPMPEPVG
jgi:hypothetical protein